jgi:hypothetical protein
VEECLHGGFRLPAAARVAERMNQCQLRGLQLRVNLDRAPEARNRLVGAFLLEQAAPEFFMALGVARLGDQRVAQQRLRFPAAPLAVERRAEEPGEVRLAGVLSERVAAKLLRQARIAGAQEGEGSRTPTAGLAGGCSPPCWQAKRRRYRVNDSSVPSPVSSATG